MRSTIIALIIKTLLICIISFSICHARENPFLFTGSPEPDGKLGAFDQNNTGDCFFLASLIAIVQDAEGKQLIESSFHKHARLNQWQIVFPNLSDIATNVTQQEIKNYKLINSDGDGFSEPVFGDPDIRILEIAADKIWKKTIKANGLWDDVPMNAVYMFSNSQQLLIWNRLKAENPDILDIDKYQRIPKGIIKEIKISSSTEAENLLKNIISSDTDGISMILIDYNDYHAVAIDNINFSRQTYSYIDTYSRTRHEAGLKSLLEGIASGYYAINYIEIRK
jgi:hypothetical protein